MSNRFRNKFSLRKDDTKNPKENDNGTVVDEKTIGSERISVGEDEKVIGSERIVGKGNIASANGKEIVGNHEGKIGDEPVVGSNDKIIGNIDDIGNASDKQINGNDRIDGNSPSVVTDNGPLVENSERPVGNNEQTIGNHRVRSETGSSHGSWGDFSSHPPSYESIFGQFQDTTDGGGNSLEYFRTVVVAFLGTAGCTLSLMLLMAIPLSMILIGAKYKDDCPVEPFIPIYLIVGGSFGVFKMLLVIIQGILYNGDVFIQRHTNNDKQNDERPSAWIFIDGFLNLFLFTWFIAGNIWVYSNYRPYFEPTPHHLMSYCNETLYLFSFWVITACYIVIGLLCACTCCLGLCASCTAYYVAANNSNDT